MYDTYLATLLFKHAYPFEMHPFDKNSSAHTLNINTKNTLIFIVNMGVLFLPQKTYPTSKCAYLHFLKVIIKICG